mgnify:CR=1 FL=1
MTDITIDLNESEGFVVSSSERTSDWVAAFISYNNLLAALGTADERSLGYMLITSPSDLYARLSATYDTGWYILDGQDPDTGDEIYTNGTPDGGDGLPNWPNGPQTNLNGTLTGFGDDFFSVLRYLQYGGRCIVAGKPDNIPETVNNAVETIENIPDVINCIFNATGSETENDIIIGIAENRGDCLAICQVDVKAPISTTTPNGLPTTNTQSRNTFHVAGQIVSLGASASLTTGDDTNSNLVTTGAAAHVAGLCARRNVSNLPYGSIAGLETGRFLNAIRMEYDLTSADRDALAEKSVNPIRTFTGIPPVLFGDQTGNSNSDDRVFNYVNVSLTYHHINRAISDIVRQYMFRENTAANRASLTTTIQTLLRRVLSAGGISEFSVQCDDVNNPENVVLSGNLICDVIVKFVLSIQSINLRFRTLKSNQTTQSSAASASTSGGTSTSGGGGSSTSSGSSY